MMMLRKLRSWAAGAVALATAAIVVVPAHASPARDGYGAGHSETRKGVGTLSQKALRILIRALKSPGLNNLLQSLTKYQATEEQIGVMVRYSAATAKILQTFTKVDQASLAFVRGQVEANLVKHFRATQVDASRVGFWVEKLLDWGM